MTDNELLLRFDADDGTMALVLEDDNRVAYAYLLENERVVSDVWLYNVAPAPETVQWDDPTGMPFLNPVHYCKIGPIPRLRPGSVIQCRWMANGVELFVDGVKWARLAPEVRPAWSRWALRKGPLAQPLEMQ